MCVATLEHTIAAVEISGPAPTAGRLRNRSAGAATRRVCLTGKTSWTESRMQGLAELMIRLGVPCVEGLAMIVASNHCVLVVLNYCKQVKRCS